MENIKLVIVAHGDTTPDSQNYYLGWTDVDLSSQGMNEAKHQSKLLKDIQFDIVYSSPMKRTIKTWNIIAEEINQHHVTIIKTWKLNDRLYGKLEKEKKSKHDSLDSDYNKRPPSLGINDIRNPRRSNKYSKVLNLPTSEVFLFS